MLRTQGPVKHMVNPSQKGSFAHFYRATSLSGLRILVAEDEYIVARALTTYLQDAGAIVAGPAPSLAHAHHLVDKKNLSCAIVDIHLGGELAFSLADRLAAEQIPFVFYSGDCSRIPPRHQRIRCIQKRHGAEDVASAMLVEVARHLTGLAQTESAALLSLDALLPRLRGMARALVGDMEAADAIVEEALLRVLAATDAGERSGCLATQLPRLIEQIWYDQKLSRPS